MQRAVRAPDVRFRSKRRETALQHLLSAYGPITDERADIQLVGFVPCVDGSEVARTFFTFAALVGAPVCSAFRCGSHDRWP